VTIEVKKFTPRLVIFEEIVGTERKEFTSACFKEVF
jgi:hypothetical protein